MIFRIRSPKGIFGQNISDLPNGSLTGVSRSLQSAILKNVHCLSLVDFFGEKCFLKIAVCSFNSQ